MLHGPSQHGREVLQAHEHVDHEMIIPRGVTLKIALDLNNGVADASSERSERFTCPSSLDLVHRLRKCSHAVLVGRGTVQQDNCTLTVRRVPPEVVECFINGVQSKKVVQPTRIVIDPGLKLIQSHDENQYAILNDSYETIVYHALSDGEILTKGLQSKILQLPENVLLVRATTKYGTGELFDIRQEKTLSPQHILDDLNARGKMHIMVEGGPETAKIFLQDHSVDRAIIIRAPLHFKQPIPSGITDEILRQAGLTRLGTRLCGVDTVEYWTRDGLVWPSPSLQSWP